MSRRLDYSLPPGYNAVVKPRRLQLGLMLLLLAALLGYGGWAGLRDRSQNRVIKAAAARYGVEPALVKAVVWRESRFRPDTRGRAGEIGLMQLREEAAQEWADSEHLEAFTHEHCFDPATNTLAGAFYLRKLLKRYSQTDNPVPYALADYNAGRGNVLKWNSGSATTNSSQFIAQIGFPMTRSYVQSVRRRYAFYLFLSRIGWD